MQHQELRQRIRQKAPSDSIAFFLTVTNNRCPEKTTGAGQICKDTSPEYFPSLQESVAQGILESGMLS